MGATKGVGAPAEFKVEWARDELSGGRDREERWWWSA